MIHEIINPSDPYTIECDDMALLTASVFALGEGAYGTTSSDTDYEVPVTIFGGNGVEIFKNNFDLDFAEYVGGNRNNIADCLDTVCIGSANDRVLYFSALNKITDDKLKEDFKKEWYDKNQSSLNQIGQRAYAMADALREAEKQNV